MQLKGYSLERNYPENLIASLQAHCSSGGLRKIIFEERPSKFN